MAGVTVTVCLPPEAASDLEGALETALAPFCSDSEDNPVQRGMWDSRRIRGGSNGLGFAVAPGCADDPRLIHDDPALDGTPRPSAPGVCAGGPRALLDFSRPRLASERAAAASWDLWHSLSAVPTAYGCPHSGRLVEVWEHGIEAVHAFCESRPCPHDPPLPAVWPGSEPHLADLPGDTILVRVHCHC